MKALRFTHARLFAKLYSWHRRLGLFLALHLFLLCTTGTILVFHKDEAEEKSFSSDSLDPAFSLQKLLDRAQNSDPSGRPLAINFDDHDPNRLTIRMGKDGSRAFRGSSRQTFDRQTGEVASSAIPSDFWDFVLRLHREFLLGFYGKLYVGFIGFLFLLSLLSGFYIYGPLSKRLNFGTIRTQNRTRIWSDVHRLLGGGSIVWLLLIALTGTLLATSGQLLKIFQYSELNALRSHYKAALDSPFEPISIDQALDAAQRERPDSIPSFITFPDTEFSTTVHYIFVMNEPSGWNRFLNELVLVDARDGSVSEVRSLPWYLKAALLSEPLHFGNYGGLPLKLIWAFFGAVSVLLVGSGVGIYVIKQEERDGKPSRRPKAKSRHELTPKTRRSPYTIPSLLALSLGLGCLGAMTGDGGIDSLSAALAFVPLAFFLYKTFQAFRS